MVSITMVENPEGRRCQGCGNESSQAFPCQMFLLEVGKEVEVSICDECLDLLEEETGSAVVSYL